MSMPMKKIMPIALFCSLVAAGPPYALGGQADDDVYQSYREAKGSLLHREVTFDCAGYTFNYVSGYLGRDSLYIREGLQWIAVPDFQAMDFGITFTAELDVYPRRLDNLYDLPVTDDVYGDANPLLEIKQRKPAASITSLFDVEIDFSRMTSSMTNRDSTRFKVEIDFDRYRTDQRLSYSRSNSISFGEGQGADALAAVRSQMDERNQWSQELEQRVHELRQQQQASSLHAMAQPGELTIFGHCW